MYNLYELLTFLSIFCKNDENVVIHTEHWGEFFGTVSEALHCKDNSIIRVWKNCEVLSFGYNIVNN